MKLRLPLRSILHGLTSAFAAPLRPIEDVRTDRVPGASGFDKEIVQVHADSEDFDRGVYYIRLNVRERRLVNYRLPRATFTQYCSYHRMSGGSVGDYKPKGVNARIMIQNPSTNRFETISSEGDLNADYNETPVVRSYEYHPRGTKLSAPFRSPQMDALIEACRRGGRPSAIINVLWETYARCRWKPELWHKPELFKVEYDPMLNANASHLVLLQCIDR